MYKNEIINILEDWNFWKKDLDTGIVRQSYLDKLTKFLTTKQVVVITGARRSGKSFIMRQLAKLLIEKKVPKNEILMINFDDPRFMDLNPKTLQKIYETYLEFLNPMGKPYIFLDEVQEVNEWEKWIRAMHELDKAKFIISGSNAKLLSKELSTLLTGRHIDLTVFPLSFKEYLVFNKVSIEDRLDIVNKRIEIKSLLREYIEFGSFPEVVLNEEKKQILLNYFDDLVNKDIVRRYNVRKSEKLKSLAKFYLSNISTLTTFNSIEKFLDTSADTIEKFSTYFENVYVLFFLKRFSFKVKQQEKSPRKVYSIDTGLANALGFRFTQNIGKLAENIVLLELKKREAIDFNMEVFYWKDINHREVDFVVKNGLKIDELIQVCWDIDNIETRKREIKSLIKAANELNQNHALVITEDFEDEEKINGIKVNFVPLWKWLI